MLTNHCIQTGFIKPIIDDLATKGVNTNRLLRASGLNMFDFSVPESYVPASGVYRLFSLLSRYEGLADINEISERIQIISMGLWGEMTAAKPNILSAILFTSKYDQVQISFETISLSIRGKFAKYQCHYYDNPNSEGRDSVVNIVLATIINFSRIVGGKNWYPMEIHYPGKHIMDIDRLLPSQHKTKVYLNQPSLTILYSTAFLANALNHSKSFISEMDKSNSMHIRIHEIISSTDQELMPTIDVISEKLDTSVRSLQRKLDIEGITYSEIIDQWRMSEAFKYLEEPSKTNKEISELLKYSNHQAFERAFQRWANTTPSSYRDQ